MVKRQVTVKPYLIEYPSSSSYWGILSIKSKDCICVNTNVQNDVCENGYTAKMHKTDNMRCSCTKIFCKDCI